MFSIWILPGLTLQAGFNSFWINSLAILQSRKKCPLKKSQNSSQVIILEELLTPLFFHLVFDLYTQQKTAESDRSSRNKEPFFEYNEMIIMLGAWLNPTKYEGLYDIFDSFRIIMQTRLNPNRTSLESLMKCI